MYKYRVPATSANLGIGFDCLGLALNIYNYFYVEESKTFVFKGFMDLDLKDNLFYIAYLKSCEYFKTGVKALKVVLKANIPIARGLGSSSALIVGGIYACLLINKLEINKEKMLEIATIIEGHPDNVAPCIYGGLCCVNNDSLLNIKVSNKWNFALFIPEYEVKTSEARKVLKRELSLDDSVNNISSAIIGIEALKTFDINNIKVLNNDKIHEPYRKKLIKDYEECRKVAMANGVKVFLISGSGSSMLMISDLPIKLEMKDISFVNVKVDQKGVACLKNYSL